SQVIPLLEGAPGISCPVTEVGEGVDFGLPGGIELVLLLQERFLDRPVIEKEVVGSELGGLRTVFAFSAQDDPQRAWSDSLHGLQHLAVTTELNQKVRFRMPGQFGIPRLVGPVPKGRRSIDSE